MMAIQTSHSRLLFWGAAGAMLATSLWGCSGPAEPTQPRHSGPLTLAGEGLTLMIVGTDGELEPNSFRLVHFKATDAMGEELRWRDTLGSNGRLGPFIGIDINGQNNLGPIKADGELSYKGTAYELQVVLEKRKAGGMTKWVRKAFAIRRIVGG